MVSRMFFVPGAMVMMMVVKMKGVVVIGPRALRRVSNALRPRGYGVEDARPCRRFPAILLQKQQHNKVRVSANVYKCDPGLKVE